MDKVLKLGIFLLAPLLANSQCLPQKIKAGFVRLNMVKDFCANPNGKSNSFKAFSLAAEFIRKRGGNCELFIPKGTYKINSQESGWQVTSPIMAFSNCKNIIIKGDPLMRTKIEYANNLHYGGYDNAGNPINSTTAGIKATPGNFIYLSNSSNITIKSIEINGQNSTMILGGYTNTHNGKLIAYQLQHSGIAIWNNSTNITLDKLYLHHFALDGIVINKDVTKPKNIYIKNTRCEYNGRQGLSWSGGDFIQVENCGFNYTGRGKVQDPPMAGVDIEPNGGINSASTNGKFINCEMKDNFGHALLNPYSNEMITEKVQFENCKFHDFDGNQIGGVQSCAVAVMGKQLSFKNCQIWGGFFYGHRAVNANDATKFNNCDFADESKNGLFTAEPFLIYTERHTNYMKFENCTFRVIHPGKRFVFAITANIDDEASYIMFKNCQFIYGLNHSSTWNSTAVFKGCQWQGNTSFVNNAQISKAISSVKWIESGALIIHGSPNPQSPSNFTIGHQIRWNHSNSISATISKNLFRLGNTNTNKYLNVVFDENSTLCLGSPAQESSLSIQNGAHLKFTKEAILNVINGGISIDGKLFLEEGSYFMLDKTKMIQSLDGIINVAQHSKPLSTYFPPFNLDPSSQAFNIDAIDELKIDGNNVFFIKFKR